jgi:hypothetical protein
MELADALKLARGGRALLFLGAGFSAGTPNSGSGEMKTGQGLSDLLAAKVGLPAGTSLTDSSEAYLESFRAEELVKELIAEFSVKTLMPFQTIMAKVPWKHVYTTNYDNVVEKSFEGTKTKITSVNPDTRVAGVRGADRLCVHLNGSIIGITPDRLAGQIRLTDSSYLTSSLANSEWAVRLRQDIDAAQAVFYVGYSTYDLDIARLLYEKPALKEKSFFAVGEVTNPILRRRIEKFGTDLHLCAAQFFGELIKDEYKASAALNVAEYCIKRYEPQASTTALKDVDVFDLFRLGQLQPPLVFESVVGDIQYALARQATEKILRLIQSAPSSIVVHSALGNGKTVILELLKAHAASAGFTVFSLLRQKGQLYEELEFAAKQPGSLLFVVDNYPNWLDALKFLGNHHKGNLSVVMAARSGTNDVVADRVEALLKLGDLHEIAVDHLAEEEILRIAQLMDTYGLWGERASLSLSAKHKFLINHCGREWQAILVELFKAPQIKDRLDKLITDIKDEASYNLVLITILLLAVVDYPATTDILTDLCGERILTVGFRQNSTIRELIDFESDEVRLRSSVTGAFLLKNVADPELVLSTLIAITVAADRGASVSREYLAILGSLVRFGNAQNFFPVTDSTTYVLRYYESVKELNSCKRYPLFWLQYAMACLFIDDFARAGKYFASAYSFATLTKFRTYQIDNHYARYLLRKSINDDDLVAAMDSFREARKLLFEQMRHDRLRYPFKVAALIGDWFDVYSDRLSLDHRAEVKRAAIFICSRIASLPPEFQTVRDIAECNKRMQVIAQQA